MKKISLSMYSEILRTFFFESKIIHTVKLGCKEQNGKGVFFITVKPFYNSSATNLIKNILTHLKSD